MTCRPAAPAAPAAADRRRASGRARWAMPAAACVVALLLALAPRGTAAGDFLSPRKAEPPAVGASRPRRSQVPLEVTVRVGLGADLMALRLGSWVPVRVHIATRDVAFRGVLTVGIDSVRPVRHIAAVDLPGPSSKEYAFLVRVPRDRTPALNVEVTDASGARAFWATSDQHAMLRARTPEERADRQVLFERVEPPDQQVALTMMSESLWRLRRSRGSAGEDPFLRGMTQVSPFRAWHRAGEAGGDRMTAQWLLRLGEPGARGEGPGMLAFSATRSSGAFFQMAIRAQGSVVARLANALRAAESGLFGAPDEDLRAEHAREAALLERLGVLRAELAAREEAAMRELALLGRRAASGFSRVDFSSVGDLPHQQRLVPGGLTGSARDGLVVRILTPHDSTVEEGTRYTSGAFLDDYYMVQAGLASGSGDGDFGALYARHADAPVFLRSEVALLPDDPIGYDGVDVVVWEDLNPSEVRPEQERALRTWLEAGGRLVLAGGVAAKWPGSWLEELSPALLGEVVLHRFRFENPVEPLWAVLGGRTLPVRELLLRPEAERVATSAGRALVAERRVGGGVVVASAFSLAEFSGLCGSDPVPLGVMGHFFPLKPTSARFAIHGTVADRLERAAAGPADPLVSTDGVFFLAAAFLVVGLGVNAVVAFRLRRPLLFWWVLGVLSVAVCGAHVVWSLTGGASAISVRQYAWIAAEAGAPVGRATQFVGLRARLPARVEVAPTEGPSMVLPFREHGPSDPGALSLLREKLGDASPRALRPLDVAWRGGESPAPRLPATTLSLGHDVQFGATSFVALGGGVSAVEEVVAGEAGGASRRLLRVRNDTAHRLVEVVLYEDPCFVHEVADLEPGGEAVVELASVRQRRYVDPSLRFSLAAAVDFTLVWGDLRGLVAPAASAGAAAPSRQPTPLDRLAGTIPDYGEGAAAAVDAATGAPPENSVVRALLGFHDENAALLRSRLPSALPPQLVAAGFAPFDVLGVTPPKAFSANANRPDDALTLVARLAEPPLGLDLGAPPGRAVEHTTLQFLAVRLPRPGVGASAPEARPVRIPAPARPAPGSPFGPPLADGPQP